MNISWILNSHRKSRLGATALVLPLLLSTCAVSIPQLNQPTSQPNNQLADHLTRLPANIPIPKPAPRYSSSAVRHSSATVRNLQEAAVWYSQYYALTPDDLLGLKHLTGVCTVLEDAGVEDESCRGAALQVMGAQKDKEREREIQGESEILDSPAAMLRETLKTQTDDQYIVAGLLGLPVQNVALRSNLVENGDWMTWDGARPEAWGWSNMVGQDKWNRGLFVGGREDLHSYALPSIRIDGFWMLQDIDLAPARSGYVQVDSNTGDLLVFPLDTEAIYALSFDYRTSGTQQDIASIWTNLDALVFYPGDCHLPPTSGSWHHGLILGANHSGVDAAIRILFRSFGTGSMWFDRIQFRRIDISGTSVKGAHFPTVWTSGIK